MKMDVRDQSSLGCSDILRLNFIRTPGTYVYRRHYRCGLRSHIMEVLDREELEKERTGLRRNGVMIYPRAKPLKMLRIFRTRFRGKEQAREEIRRVKRIERYLAPDFMAMSEEFLVTYTGCGGPDFLLCGLQQYVEGEVLDPWRGLGEPQLEALFARMESPRDPGRRDRYGAWIGTLRQKAKRFIGKLQEMILGEGLVPDLAGVGNLLITREGDIKLVDINNISTVSFGADVLLDDRGYPVCDKSIEALSLLEQNFLDDSGESGAFIYRVFLDPERMKKVKAAEAAFHRSVHGTGSALESSLS